MVSCSFCLKHPETEKKGKRRGGRQRHFAAPGQQAAKHDGQLGSKEIYGLGWSLGRVVFDVQC